MPLSLALGAFTPEMRESDDALIATASVFVDTRAGALVNNVADGTPAQKAMLKPGDVIQEINRKPVRDAEEAIRLTENPDISPTGTNTELLIFRALALADLEELARDAVERRSAAAPLVCACSDEVAPAAERAAGAGRNDCLNRLGCCLCIQPPDFAGLLDCTRMHSTHPSANTRHQSGRLHTGHGWDLETRVKLMRSGFRCVARDSGNGPGGLRA